MKKLFFGIEGWAKELMNSKIMTILSLLIFYISLVVPAVCLGAILRFKMPDAIWNSNLDTNKAFFTSAVMPIFTEGEQAELKDYLNSEYINSSPVISVPIKLDGAKEAFTFGIRGIDETFLKIVAIKGNLNALLKSENQCYIREDHLKDMRLRIGDEIALAEIPYKVSGTYQSDLIEDILIPKLDIQRFVTGKKVRQFFYFYAREELNLKLTEHKWYEFFSNKQIVSEKVQFMTENTYNTMFQRFRGDFYKRFGIPGGILCFIAIINLFLFLRLKGQKELYNHAIKRSLGVSRKLLFAIVLLDALFYSMIATIMLILSLPFMVRFFSMFTFVELSPVLYGLMFLYSLIVFASIRGLSFWKGQKQEVLVLLKKEGGSI